MEVGAQTAGFTPLWSVEMNPAIAEVHRANIGGRMLVKRVQDVDPKTLERPDALHASTICTNASVANVGGEECEEDRSQAEAVCNFLRVLTPAVFTLENVMQYRRFKSFARILATLDELGYWTTVDICNAADYGVPQTRKRLIVRACREAVPPPLPAPVPWVGWYAAIEDLLPDLPESWFAKWQLERLPAELMTCLVESRNSNQEFGDGLRALHEPATTVTTDDRPSHAPKGFLVEGTSAGDRPPTVRQSAEPAPTICGGDGGRVHRAYLPDQSPTQLSFLTRPAGYGPEERGTGIFFPDQPASTIMTNESGRRAFLVDCQNNGNAGGERGLTIRQPTEPSHTITGSQNKRTVRAWLEQGRVVSMTPRALARFQSLPDSYLLPTGKGATRVACAVIGNGVPCLMVQRIYEGLREVM